VEALLSAESLLPASRQSCAEPSRSVRICGKQFAGSVMSRRGSREAGPESGRSGAESLRPEIIPPVGELEGGQVKSMVMHQRGRNKGCTKGIMAT
jgi:hypothetical protein